MKHWGPAVAGLIATVGGCSVVVDANRTQCSTNADCVARGAEFAGSSCIDSFCQPARNWACLDAPALAPTASAEEYQVSFVVQDTVTSQPRPGLAARLCLKLDVDCTNAVSSIAITDDQGLVAFQAPSGFEGYARFEGGDAVPGMYFLNPPVVEDTLNIPIALSAPDTVAGLASLIGATQEDLRGIVLISTVDCTGTPAAGITLASDSQDARATAFYAQQGFPSAKAVATDSSGYGGVLNASPGIVEFSASLADSGRPVDKVTMLVQPGTQTMTRLVPRGR